MNFIKKITPFLFIFVFFMFVPNLTIFAQSTVNTGSYNGEFSKLKNPIESETVQDFVRAILEGVIKIGIPLVALAIIYSGFLFVVAIGNPGKIEEAKSALINTLIGAALLLGAWGLSELIVETVKSL